MRIGITTHFHDSNNYGGLLQAYALVIVIQSKIGFTTEQIDIPIWYHRATERHYSFQHLLNFKKMITFVKCKVKANYLNLMTRIINRKLTVRGTTFKHFSVSIPHSEEYSFDNLTKCSSEYDLFITGSDQVWNYSWYNPTFFLTFTTKPKISYAASIGHNELPDEWKNKYQQLIKDFSAISVREEEAVDLLQPISQVKVEWVLDPTLLLTIDDWNEICPERRIKEQYMFCYFLGGSKRDRKVAKEVAKQKGLKIVTLPHLLGSYRSVDRKFGDYQLWDVSPADFVSLVKYADFVLTDSFHGSVFANIYHIPYAVFEREGAKGMSGRLKSLTELTDTQDRFLVSDDLTNADYICSLSTTMPAETDKLKEMRRKSMDFLETNIKAIDDKGRSING